MIALDPQKMLSITFFRWCIEDVAVPSPDS